jgi:hypothetical protein
MLGEVARAEEVSLEDTGISRVNALDDISMVYSTSHAEMTVNQIRRKIGGQSLRNDAVGDP